IDSLRFYYGVEGRISPTITIQKNLPLIGDMLGYGRRSRELDARVKAFAPHVAISDAEPWTHRVAWRLGIPRVGFDHFGIMVHCHVPLAAGDWVKSFLDRFMYKLLMGKPERILVSSFYDAPPKRDDTKVIGPLLREEVRELRGAQSQDHLLVYLNNGQHQLTPELHAAFRGADVPIKMYGAGRTDRDGNIEFRPPAGRAFLEDLATSRAVVSTAGNQLVGEALFFGRPLLVIPEGTVEQRMNAEAVARLGVGEVTQFDTLDADVLRSFLRNVPRYAAKARERSTDGREAALVLLDKWIHELGKQKKKARQRALRPVNV
ncbi:MAG: glycosyltransferase family protein, partial [Myxococcota bacterium]